MQIIVNEEYVRSRVKIGNTTHLVSLALLGAGFVLSFSTAALGQGAIFGAYAAMVGALLLLNFGRGYTRRFGSRFRQDQMLIPGLRGLDNRHTLINYPAPHLPDHLLLGPTGLYVLIPRPQGGTIRFDGRRWSRGSIGSSLLRNLAEGGVGNPIADVRQALGKLADYLREHGSEDVIKGLEARPVIVFTNPNVRLDVRNSPVPAVSIREFRTVFRKAKPTLTPEKQEELLAVLSRETRG